MCNKKIVFVVFVFSVFCFIMLGHPLSFAEEKAFDEAGINYFIQKLFYKNGDQRREKKDQGDMLKCATPILKYAFAHKELILPQNRFIFYSPMSLYKYEYFGSAEIWHYESPGGNFKIHYTEDNSHGDAVDGSDGIKETVPDYVKRLATFFDNVWTRVVYEMGYEAPEFNSYKPGAEPGVFDVYLKNINAYGYTIFDFEPPYIVIHKDLNFDHYTNDDPEGTQIGNMKVTAAHEFFHIIQYNYNFWSSESISFSISNQWWEESTAVWIEDIVFDEVNDYIRYLPDTFENFNLSLDFNSSDFGSFNYGEVIWPIFLSETYGQGIILDIFNRCKQIYPPLAKTAIGDIFEVYNSSWDEALSQFYLKNLIRDYEEGERFPKIYENSKCLDDIVYSYQIERGYSSLNNGPLDHLSCNYMKFEPGIRSKNLNLTLLTPENTISPITILIGDKSSSGGPTKYTIDSYSWRHSDMDFILNRFGAMDVYKYAYLIIINSDPTDKNCFYNIGANYLQILSQYLSIDKPLPGDIIVVNEGITSVPLTLSVNNLPPDPSDPQRSLKYNFELYKSPGSPPFYSDTLDEETAGVTSLEINVYQGFGGYYWRCQAESQDRSKSMWTSLAFFYIQPVREILAQEVTPGHEFKVEVLTPESSIYGTSVEGIFEGNEDQEIIIAEAVPPDVDTGNIAPVGEWIYIAPHGLVLSESSCIKLTYTDRELYDAGLTDHQCSAIHKYSEH